jgi:hypothetical protein
MSAVFLVYPQRYFPALDVAFGKLGFNECRVWWTTPDTFVRRGFEFRSQEVAEMAYHKICALIFQLDAIGSWIWLGK